MDGNRDERPARGDRLTYATVANVVYDINGYDDAYKHARLLEFVREIRDSTGVNIRTHVDGEYVGDRKVAEQIKSIVAPNIEQKLRYAGTSDGEKRKVLRSLVRISRSLYGTDIPMEVTDFTGTHPRTIEEISDDIYWARDRYKANLDTNSGITANHLKELASDLRERRRVYSRTLRRAYAENARVNRKIRDQRGKLDKLLSLINEVNAEMEDRVEMLRERVESMKKLANLDHRLEELPGYAEYRAAMDRISDPAEREREKLAFISGVVTTGVSSHAVNAKCYTDLGVEVSAFKSMDKQDKVRYIRSKYAELVNTSPEMTEDLKACLDSVVGSIERDMSIDTATELTASNFGALPEKNQAGVRRFLFTQMQSKLASPQYRDIFMVDEKELRRRQREQMDRRRQTAVPRNYHKIGELDAAAVGVAKNIPLPGQVAVRSVWDM